MKYFARSYWITIGWWLAKLDSRYGEQFGLWLGTTMRHLFTC